MKSCLTLLITPQRLKGESLAAQGSYQALDPAL